jgi:XTP/dITP diphosphohydrolase
MRGVLGGRDEFQSAEWHSAVYFRPSMSSAKSILIASNNAHKLQEFREIFSQFGASDIELLTPESQGISLDPEETGGSYLGNARIKARAFHDQRPELWVIADDSGLEVDALEGRPGLHSARYHRDAPHRDGCAQLLSEMKAVPIDRRSARFRACIVLMDPNGREHSFEGVCEGSIGFEKRGSGGFGFDPVFVVAGGRRHLAELPPEEKHRLSHRGLAAQQVIAFLRSASDPLIP